MLWLCLAQASRVALSEAARLQLLERDFTSLKEEVMPAESSLALDRLRPSVLLRTGSLLVPLARPTQGWAPLLPFLHSVLPVRTWRFFLQSPSTSTHQLVRATVLAQIPHLDTACLIARHELSLVGVNDHVIHGGAMIVDALRP